MYVLFIIIHFLNRLLKISGALCFKKLHQLIMFLRKVCDMKRAFIEGEMMYIYDKYNRLSESNNKYSLVDNIITCGFSFIMWIIMGFNKYNADYFVYEHIFKSVNAYGIQSSLNIESGFQAIMRLIGMFTNDYQVFLRIFSLIAILLFLYSLKRYTKKVGLILFLFCLFGFLSNAIQLRSFLSMSFLLLGTWHLIYEDGFKSIIKFLLYVLVGSQFHITILFYLILLVIKFSTRTIYLITLILILSITAFYGNIVLLFGDTKFAGYVSSQSGLGLTKTIVLFIYFVCNLILIWTISTADKRLENEPLAKKIFFINLLVSSSMILVVVNNNFIRFIRNIYILNYVVFSNFVLLNYKCTKMKNYFFIVVYFLFIFISLYFFTIQGSAFEIGVKPLFTDNLFLDRIIKFFK
ncbi:EpsG family protein [Enterococcus devriesei]|uniref:EpsG family protein n=1 Tax=Enterococcus devriesei TaxID=319970 RepID=UPI0036D3806E